MNTFISITIFLVFYLLMLTDYAFSYPLCTNLRAPFTPKTSLSFCQYNGSVCCNSTDDQQLQKKFKALKVSSPGCASILKSILCSRCDPFSAELYRVESVPRAVPVLCNSTLSANSTQSPVAAVDFCSKVWDQCQNVTISNSPFALQGKDGSVANSSSKLTDMWQSKTAFCNEFGGMSDDGSVCFDGKPISLNSSRALNPPPNGICLEKIGNGSFLNMVPHPDGSNRVFLANQQGRCSCNSDVGCDPAQLAPDNGAQPCQYHSVIAEFTANGTISQPSSFTTIHPAEVRRIFTIGLPFTSHHGGQILFGPEDGYLYFMMGDGGNVGDPYNFAQNKKSLLGKIMRLDIDNIPSAQTIANLDLWGNYSVPGDNPYIEDKDLQPEIWALGFRNPWRCSFDAERSSYFLCADVGQDQFEEVDIVTKGGNYGWRIYEGRSLYNPPSFPGGNTSASSINPIFPVMGYNHSDVNRVEGYASITGGYFYRSMTDPCMYGRYLYADLYEGAVWAGTESPGDSGNFTSTSLPVKCTNDSPIPCTIAAGNTTATPALGFTFSFGQDNRKDVYILTSSGVYRIARPSRCNFVCSKENITASPPSSGPSSPSSPSGAEQLGNPLAELLLFFSFSLLLYLNI
ncbi:HIPL1 protein-like isoform X2 [Mercurialis annua]|uniref:HIPL1 protein-like isoform X2 n=1 Tax=Mercurialis annua TaxID=3986 RepID=UPI002160B0CA|nr:HIPL1 protein-like isoform X2 [Mercurialis annua]